LWLKTETSMWPGSFEESASLQLTTQSYELFDQAQKPLSETGATIPLQRETWERATAGGWKEFKSVEPHDFPMQTRLLRAAPVILRC